MGDPRKREYRYFFLRLTVTVKAIIAVVNGMSDTATPVSGLSSVLVSVAAGATGGSVAGVVVVVSGGVVVVVFLIVVVVVSLGAVVTVGRITGGTVGTDGFGGSGSGSGSGSSSSSDLIIS